MNRMRRTGTGLILLLMASCSTSGSYTWAWYTVSPWHPAGRTNLQYLLSGLLTTLSLSAVSILLSVILGIILVIMAFSPVKFLRQFNRAWVEVFRSVPVLVMLLWTYYGLPVSLGINLGIIPSAILALALCDSAFEAELFRAGIQSIPDSQREAARIMGCSETQMFRFILLPQAVRILLPGLVNQFIYMLKISSLASVIGLGELTRKANELTVTEYRPLEIYTVLIAEYLVLVLILSYFSRKLEKKMASGGYV